MQAVAAIVFDVQLPAAIVGEIEAEDRMGGAGPHVPVAAEPWLEIKQDSWVLGVWLPVVGQVFAGRELNNARRLSGLGMRDEVAVLIVVVGLDGTANRQEHDHAWRIGMMHEVGVVGVGEGVRFVAANVAEKNFHVVGTGRPQPEGRGLEGTGMRRVMGDQVIARLDGADATFAACFCVAVGPEAELIATCFESCFLTQITSSGPDKRTEYADLSRSWLELGSDRFVGIGHLRIAC